MSIFKRVLVGFGGPSLIGSLTRVSFLPMKTSVLSNILQLLRVESADEVSMIQRAEAHNTDP